MSGIEGSNGLPEGLDVTNKVFYGFKLDPQTGKLTLQIIDDDTSAIKLPDLGDNISEADGYKNWFWSKNLVQFQWGNQGHLQVKIV